MERLAKNELIIGDYEALLLVCLNWEESMKVSRQRIERFDEGFETANRPLQTLEVKISHILNGQLMYTGTSGARLPSITDFTKSMKGFHPY